jgi:multicomponent Na+:H+ antiporter subunit A
LLTVNLAIFIPFIAAVLIPFIQKIFPRIHIGWFVLFVPAALFIGLARYIPFVARGETYLGEISWIPSFDIYFSTYLDGLSMIFGLLITGVGALVILYSIYYLSPKESLRHFYIYLLLFMGAMLGVVFSDSLMVLYVFWELTSISSFLLIAFWYHRKGSRYGARKSLLITMSGGFAMLAGFIMIYGMTGTFSIREIISVIGDVKGEPLFLPALLLVLLGAFTKSAQFPFHIWLPDAMEAPTPVSAYLHSATMVKAGIYLVARFTPVFGGEGTWFWLVSGVGLLTLFWGSFSAIRQTDLKALLAYSTVSQLGLIMSLFGIGSASLHMHSNVEITMYTQATFAALFHLINHSTFKGALFMVIGILDFQVGTRDVRRLGGLLAFMPVSFTVALIGSFSMAGLPPFNGFLSKEMFFTAVVNVRDLNIFHVETFGILFPVIAWVASVFTFVYCMIIVFQTFFGPYHLERLEKKSYEASAGMLIAPVTLAVLVVAIFFFPNVLGAYVIRPAMASVFPSFVGGDYLGQTISAWHGLTPEVWMTLGVIILGILLYLSRSYWKGVYSLFPERFSLDQLYYDVLEGTEKLSTKLTSFYMTGYLRHYLLYIYFFFAAVIGGILFYTGAFDASIANDAPISPFEWIITFVVLTAGIAIMVVKSRLTAIILNGVIGYSLAVFFVLFRAPDLAMTQIVVETVTTALFLLCFYFLPVWRKEDAPKPSKFLNGVIAVAVGTVFVLVALAVKSGKLFDTISVYFENAAELAGGSNIVNAILGDFRAFDTMLEVVVLFIAGIGVFALIKLKEGKENDKVEDK